MKCRYPLFIHFVLIFSKKRGNVTNLIDDDSGEKKEGCLFRNININWDLKMNSI